MPPSKNAFDALMSPKPNAFSTMMVAQKSQSANDKARQWAVRYEQMHGKRRDPFDRTMLYGWFDKRHRAISPRTGDMCRYVGKTRDENARLARYMTAERSAVKQALSGGASAFAMSKIVELLLECRGSSVVYMARLPEFVGGVPAYREDEFEQWGMDSYQTLYHPTNRLGCNQKTGDNIVLHRYDFETSSAAIANGTIWEAQPDKCASASDQSLSDALAYQAGIEQLDEALQEYRKSTPLTADQEETMQHLEERVRTDIVQANACVALVVSTLPPPEDDGDIAAMQRALSAYAGMRDPRTEIEGGDAYNVVNALSETLKCATAVYEPHNRELKLELRRMKLYYHPDQCKGTTPAVQFRQRLEILQACVVRTMSLAGEDLGQLDRPRKGESRINGAMSRCNNCGKTLPVTEFDQNAQTGTLMVRCKTCSNKPDRDQWYARRNKLCAESRVIATERGYDTAEGGVETLHCHDCNKALPAKMFFAPGCVWPPSKKTKPYASCHKCAKRV